MDFVSIICPIYNRNNFKKLILSNLLKLDYDKNKLEFCLYDDGDIPFFKDKEEQECFVQLIKPITFKYKYNNIQKEIGYKRNALVKLATHNIICCMDSDDLYLPNYLKHSLEVMKKEKVGLVGSPQMLFLFPELDWRMTAIDCNVKRLIHEATMVFTKKYHKSMGGFSNKGTGEGCRLIDGMIDKKIGKTQVAEIMVCICHSNNTVNKKSFEDKQNVEYKISDFEKKLIKDCLGINNT